MKKLKLILAVVALGLAVPAVASSGQKLGMSALSDPGGSHCGKLQLKKYDDEEARDDGERPTVKSGTALLTKRSK